MKFVFKVITAVVFIVLLIAVQAIYWVDPVMLSDVIAVKEEILRWNAANPILSAFTYIGLYTVSIIFGIPISATVIGGYLFGAIGGIIYSMIGLALGALILCSLARYVLGGWLQKRYKDKLEPLNKEIKKYGLHYIVMIHLMPFMPSFLPHIAAGISDLPLLQIVGVNIVGAFPLTCVYSFAGSYIHQLHSIQDFLFYVGIIATVLGTIFFLALLYKRLWD